MKRTTLALCLTALLATALPAQPQLAQGPRTVPSQQSVLLRSAVVERLVSREDSVHPEIPEVISSLETKLSRRQVLGIAAGGVMIVSGIAAAYYKDQANAQFNDYVATGNRDNLEATHSLDARSNAAFVVTQLSFVLLAYILTSD